jgi:hypothetical protein
VFFRAQPQHKDDKIKRVQRVEVPGEMKKKSCWCFCQEKKIGQQWYEGAEISEITRTDHWDPWE